MQELIVCGRMQDVLILGNKRKHLPFLISYVKIAKDFENEKAMIVQNY